MMEVRVSLFPLDVLASVLETMELVCQEPLVIALLWQHLDLTVGPAPLTVELEVHVTQLLEIVCV